LQRYQGNAAGSDGLQPPAKQKSMNVKSNISLEHYAHKTLVGRLLTMTLVIIVMVGVLVYLLEHRRMQNYVVERATDAVQLLVARAKMIMDEKGIDRYQAFRQALSEQLAVPGQKQAGEFVYAGFFKPKGDLIDEYVQSKIANGEILKHHFVVHPFIKPAINAVHVEGKTLNGRPYIYVVFPIVDRTRQVAAYAHGVFALSATTMSQIQHTVWRAVIATILIVLATSLLLYPVILRLVRRLSRFASDLLDANLQSIALLGSAIAKRDSDTDAHNYRVSIYAVRLAEAIGLDVETIRSLIKGAFLHDVGKIGIRDNILLKPGKLDDAEFEIMKTHVAHGLDIVKRSAWLTDAVDVVGGHHEKFAGEGYPRGLCGQDIPISARVFAIVDVFDALTSKRPYKEALSLKQTLAIMQEGSGKHFDPDLLGAFGKIAADLYEQYSGREDEGLHEELGKILRRYFTTDVPSFMT